MSRRQLVISGIVILIIGLLAGASLLSQWLLDLDISKQVELSIALSPWFSVFTTAATIVIAIYAGVNYRLASTIRSRDDEFREDAKTRDEEFRQQVSNLYQAIVISNLIHPPQNNTAQAIKHFRELYMGETPIFREK
jgi:hypothetical protein